MHTQRYLCIKLFEDSCLPLLIHASSALILNPSRPWCSLALMVHTPQIAICMCFIYNLMTGHSFAVTKRVLYT